MKRQVMKWCVNVRFGKRGSFYGLWLCLILCGLMTGCRVVGGAEELTILPMTDSTAVIGPAEGLPILPGKTPAETTSGRAAWIICEIKGHVAKPGVYDLGDGSRVSDLILRGGGVLDSASLEWVNQAKKLQDGEVLVIPAKGTSRAEYDAMCLETPQAPGVMPDPGNPAQRSQVNINTATQAELESIPGIGPVTAQNILDYRTQNGPFAVLEDLKKVDRIGEKTFEKLKKFITVSP